MQGVLHCEGSSQGRQAVHAHSSRHKTREGFVESSGPKVVESLGKKRYTLIVRDDVLRYAWVYFMRHKGDDTELFEQFLADARADGVTFKVVIVRSDGGGKFRAGKFGDLCRSTGIKQKFTTADSLHFNGVAERVLSLIETVATPG